MISEIELANASSFLVDYFRSNDTKQFSKKQCLLSNNKLAENILYSSVMVLVMLSSIIGQSLVVFAVIMSRQLRNRVTMYFVASLGNYISTFCFTLSFCATNFVQLRTQFA